jgi:hypothetical protein
MFDIERNREEATVPHPVQQRRPPTSSAATRARAMERVENRAAWTRAGTPAHARFACPGCGLNSPQRRSADPLAGPPQPCLRCAFLLTIPDPGMREAMRRVLAHADLKLRFSDRDVP